jgi:ribokinase
MNLNYTDSNSLKQVTVMSNIVVIGSVNTDMVIKTKHIPVPGETVLGGQFMILGGGKGANQAVAAARLGGKVSFVSKLGRDVFGEKMLQNLKNECINIDHITIDPIQPSGVAMITVDDKGENTIVVAPGANATLSITDVQNAIDVIKSSEIILVQLEIPRETVIEVVTIAKAYNIKVILNPAPACELPDALFKDLYLMTPNRKEAEMLSGININTLDEYDKAAAIIIQKGTKNLVITAGGSGAFVYTEEFTGQVPAQWVQAVDTTAAGDVFNGALAVALAQQNSIKDAVAFANRAAAISVTRMGAQASAPFLSELDVQLSSI